MGGPAGVADTGLAWQGGLAQLFFQGADLAGRAPPAQLAVMNHADAGGIIAAIFQATQAVDQPVGDGAYAHNSDDAAHEVSSSVRQGDLLEPS